MLMSLALAAASASAFAQGNMGGVIPNSDKSSSGAEVRSKPHVKRSLPVHQSAPEKPTHALGGVSPPRSLQADSECCATTHLDISKDGRVSGYYTKQNGRLSGHMQGELAVGYWAQGNSAQPCSQPKMGTTSWGRFAFHTNGGLSGVWSYCDAQPSQSWGFR